jgi:DNA-directed RNA polymerase specialized sigma subunit
MNDIDIISKWEHNQYINSRCYDNPVYKEIVLSNEQGKETDELVKIFCDLSESLASRFNINKDDKDDLIQEGVLAALKYWKHFNIERTINARSYIIQIIKSSQAGILYYIKKHDGNTIHI